MYAAPIQEVSGRDPAKRSIADLSEKAYDLIDLREDRSLLLSLSAVMPLLLVVRLLVRTVVTLHSSVTNEKHRQPQQLKQQA